MKSKIEKISSLEICNKITEEDEDFKEVKWIYTDPLYESYAPENENRRLHEAGYDAMLTGQTFIKAMQLLDADQKKFCQSKLNAFRSFFMWDFNQDGNIFENVSYLKILNLKDGCESLDG